MQTLWVLITISPLTFFVSFCFVFHVCVYVQRYLITSAVVLLLALVALVAHLLFKFS